MTSPVAVSVAADDCEDQLGQIRHSGEKRNPLCSESRLESGFYRHHENKPDRSLNFAGSK